MLRTMKVLVRVPNWIGHHVMARSFYSGLRSHFSGARVCAVGPEWLAELSYPEFFDEVLPLDNRALRRWWSTGRELSTMGFDLAVNLPASFRSALLLWAARIPKRTG